MYAPHWLDTEHGLVSNIPTFLQGLVESGKSPTTLIVYMVATAGHHSITNGISPGSHKHISNFMKVVTRLHPPQIPKKTLQWYLPLVLECLKALPYKSIHDAKLK